MNGASIGWDENSPSDSESAGLGDDRMRSMKSSLRLGLADEHSWPSVDGADHGYHLLGSGRPYYGTQSRVSSSGSDGRLMLTSDTSRLFGVGSGGTVLLGDPNLLTLGTNNSWTAPPQRAYWASEASVVVTDPTGTATWIYPNSGYSGVPFLQGTAEQKGGAATLIVMNIASKSATVATFYATDINNLAVQNVSIQVLSIGTRAL